jgi:cyclic beta-1,2-glucan synthetase
LPSSARSAYAQLFGSDAGVDPYTRVVSDVYQDLFRHGSFVGKGIYAVDAFEQALEDCLPDNRILSHDLIEGCYARSDLLSDMQLYEKHGPLKRRLQTPTSLDARRLAIAALAVAVGTQTARRAAA